MVEQYLAQKFTKGPTFLKFHIYVQSEITFEIIKSYNKLKAEITLKIQNHKTLYISVNYAN